MIFFLCKRIEGWIPLLQKMEFINFWGIRISLRFIDDVNFNINIG